MDYNQTLHIMAFLNPMQSKKNLYRKLKLSVFFYLIILAQKTEVIDHISVLIKAGVVWLLCYFDIIASILPPIWLTKSEWRKATDCKKTRLTLSAGLLWAVCTSEPWWELLWQFSWGEPLVPATKPRFKPKKRWFSVQQWLWSCYFPSTLWFCS